MQTDPAVVAGGFQPMNTLKVVAVIAVNLGAAALGFGLLVWLEVIIFVGLFG